MHKPKYLGFISEQLRAASKLAQEKYGHVTSTTKETDNNQVLTEADLAIGELLVEKVQATYPDHNVIDEEAGVIDNKSDYTWVIDPIDGTSNFANALPTYGVMIGLLEGDQAIAGGIALPAFKQMYVGEKDQGAFRNGLDITVSEETKLLSSLVAYGIDGHQENPAQTEQEAKLLGKIILNIRNLRSSNSAFDMAMVASGEYGAFLNQTTKIWDNVAVQPVIEAAGGTVTDFWGKPMDYSDPLNRVDENFTICMGAPELHRQLQEIIQQAG